VLVVDTSAALRAAMSEGGYARFRDDELFAPPLLWSEARSALHEAQWRRAVAPSEALETLAALENGPIRPRTHPRLGETAWQIADALGWAKTYDAEFLALAQLLGCRLVTSDERLRRGAARLGFVVGPAEL
jgi:predicted nucleic acid-binding protein